MDEQVAGAAGPTGEAAEETGLGPAGGRVGTARLLSRRRRANASGGRRVAHQVKVTEAEEGELTRLALAQRVTVPRLLVESALASGGAKGSVDFEVAVELFAVHRLLAAVSNNVNQIARATNATGELVQEMTAVLAAVRRTAFRIDDVLDALAPTSPAR